MCGIAGIVDLTGRNQVPPGKVPRMADAILHRGPDEDGYFERPDMVLANRRLSIVGLADGRQPLQNEDRTITAVFNGEFFDYPEVREKLQAKGHVFRTGCDTELIPHLWEDHAEGMFEHLRGQFALAVYDANRRSLVLGRDRFGICPLFWTRQRRGGEDWFLFASEIKALLASGMVPAEPDLRGIDQVFNFFAVPGPTTCFQGVELLQPGHFLRIDLAGDREPRRKTYWSIDFPEKGQEDTRPLPELVDEFDRVLLAAVERRLRADVPVVSYLSGGIDSSIVVAMAAKLRGKSVPTFTIRITKPHLDEVDQAAVTSRHIGSDPVIVSCGDAEITQGYPDLIAAAEAPVIDTSCVGLMLLAETVHKHGYKVALTGEGSDEWLAGYPWFKVHRLLSWLDVIPGIRCSGLARGLGLRIMGAPRGASAYFARVRKYIGDHTPYQDIYGIMGQSRFRFFRAETLEALGDHLAYADLEPDLERMRRWDPLNRAFYWAGRIHLPGHLLSLKGDRIAMRSSVETRYPFLDEEVFSFLARIPTKWKMRGMKDKYILRLVGERYLPREVAWRPKGMFRAPLDSFFDHGVPAYVDQLLSDESLKKTGYFDLEAVRTWKQAVFERRLGVRKRSTVELGLVGVVATQLWHHLYIDPTLADLPAAWDPRALQGTP